MRTKCGLALALALSMLAACDDAETPPLAPYEGTARFAVRSSDFTSSSIGLLDGVGDPLVTSWISSGSVTPSLVTAISSDNAFPLTPEAGVLTILDRFGVDVITRIELGTGTVLSQGRTHDTALANGFSSNPYDFVVLSPTRAFVLRYGVNADVSAVDSVKGNDLWGLDPTTLEPTGERVDLSAFDTSVTIDGEEGPVEVPVHALPNRALAFGGFLVVGLDLISEGYEDASDGKLAVVDLEDLSVESYDLSGRRNCGFLHRVPGSAARFAVQCIGYGEDAQDESGVFVLEIDGEGQIDEVARFFPSEHPGLPDVTGAIEMLSSTRFVGVDLGEYGETTDPDDVYDVSLEGVTPVVTLLFTTTKGFDVFGSIAFDAASGLLLVPDRTSGIHRWKLEGGTLGSIDTFAFGRSGLPVVDITVLP